MPFTSSHTRSPSDAGSYRPASFVSSYSPDDRLITPVLPVPSPWSTASLSVASAPTFGVVRTEPDGVTN